jgi:hypothetical protein
MLQYMYACQMKRSYENRYQAHPLFGAEVRVCDSWCPVGTRWAGVFLQGSLLFLFTKGLLGKDQVFSI